MDTFKDKRVLIFGLGLNQGGVGSAKFFASQGVQVRVTDLKSAAVLKPSLNQLKDFTDITYTLGEHKFEDIDWADLIIKNPAVKHGNPYIEYAIKIGKKVEMDMGIFLQFVKPSQIIGITGTKGKSTTASLIYEVLRVDGKDVILAGNIGKSVLDIITMMQSSMLPPRRWKARKNILLIVLEVSSFQLEAFDEHKVSLKWAVITNITPDHLNYYSSMDQYVNSKKIIGKYQTKDDFIFIRKNDPVTDQSNFLKGFKAKIIRFSKNDLPKNFKPHLMGEHNLENMAATLKVAKALGVDKKTTLSIISQFKGVPFRMELIKTWRGVKIINDTTATSPEAGIQAIQTFPGCILICGGMNKGMDYKQFVTIVKKCVNKVFFLEGDSTDTIISSLRTQRSNPSTSSGLGLKIHGPYNDLEKLLKDVKKIVHPGDTILFSPAATSFNLFQNEFDRGRQFNEAVRKLFS